MGVLIGFYSWSPFAEEYPIRSLYASYTGFPRSLICMRRECVGLQKRDGSNSNVDPIDAGRFYRDSFQHRI
jgi:hypothetical protein